MKNQKNWFHRHIVLILLIVIAVLGMFLIQNYYGRHLRRPHFINSYMTWINQKRSRAPLKATDVGLIRPWMTFDYIDKLFNIPAGYLKSQMNITDAHYPKLTLAGYARNQHTPISTIISDTASSTKYYLSTSK